MPTLEIYIANSTQRSFDIILQRIISKNIGGTQVTLEPKQWRKQKNEPLFILPVKEQSRNPKIEWMVCQKLEYPEFIWTGIQMFCHLYKKKLKVQSTIETNPVTPWCPLRWQYKGTHVTYLTHVDQVTYRDDIIEWTIYIKELYYHSLNSFHYDGNCERISQHTESLKKEWELKMKEVHYELDEKAYCLSSNENRFWKDGGPLFKEWQHETLENMENPINFRLILR